MDDPTLRPRVRLAALVLLAVMLIAFVPTIFPTVVPSWISLGLLAVAVMALAFGLAWVLRVRSQLAR